MAQARASRDRLVTLQDAAAQFQVRFVRVAALSLILLDVTSVVAGIVLRATDLIVAALAGVATFGTSYALTLRGNGVAGRRFFVYGLLANTLGVAFGVQTFQGFVMLVVLGIAGLFVVTLAGFVLEPIDMPITVLGCFVLLLISLLRHTAQLAWTGEILFAYGVAAALLVIQSVAIVLFVRNFRNNQQVLRTYVQEVDRVMGHAERIAKGDLTAQVEGDSDVSDTIRAMLEGLRGMVSRSRGAAAAISSSAQEISAMARQQEQGALEQASAVAQIHQTLARVLDGSTRATDSTEEVFRNVELTQRTTEVVAQRAAALSAHTRRISALLEIIKNIANKSEILALNAALEGARAGEAGRGFSLVASQMQRLAESVMGSVRDVRALIEDIDAATAATLSATEESTRLSAKATGAARQITGTLEQQRASTEQVAAAVRDIQQVTTQVSSGSTQAFSATRDLTRLADELKQAIEKFALD